MSHSRTLPRASVARPLPLRWLLTDARWLALAAPALIFLGHLQYGAMLSKTALSLATAAALLLAGLLIAAPRVRADLASVRGLVAPAAMFGLVVLVALWSLTPYAPGQHPVWSYLGVQPEAATMDKSRTLLELIKLLGLACVFTLGLAAGASETRARLTYNVLLALGGALAVWSFLIFATGAHGLPRLGSTFRSWNTAATLFAMLLMLAMGAALSKARTERRGGFVVAAAPFLVAGLLSLGCLVATASRGGFMAAAVGLLAFAGLSFFTGRANLSRRVLIGLGAVVLFAALLAISGEQLIERFVELKWDRDDRNIIFALHWQAFRNAPLMGAGLGSFDVVNRTLIDATNVNALWSVRAAHNVYLTWLEQAGVLGAAPMFACIASILVLTIRAGLQRSRFTAQLAALLAASAVVLFHGLTDFALETYSMAAFWSLLLGLGFSAAQGWSRR